MVTTIIAINYFDLNGEVNRTHKNLLFINFMYVIENKMCLYSYEEFSADFFF